MDNEAFLSQLPKRIAGIEDIWAKLEDGPWQDELLNALYERVREISETSKELSLFQLNESVFSLEVYLSSFVGADIRPDASKIDAISGLVRALHTAAETTDEAQAIPSKANDGVPVFVLGEKGGVTAPLSEALREIDCDVQYFTDVEILLGELQVRAPRMVIADAAKIPAMTSLSSELARLRGETGMRIPLIFVSSSSALQLRVDAIRAGGDGFFVAPLDADTVAMQIREMAVADLNAPYRVLVVEDDPTQADFAGSILRKAGIEVMQVTEPLQVMDSLREFKPDLILMDIYMPEVNGIEMTTIIRDHPEFVTTPIVFVSGEQNSERQIDALSVGGDDFICKPIRPKHLLGVVETRIRRSRQLLRATGQPAKHDRVTGLFSRQHFLDSIARVLEDESRDHAAAVLLIRPDGLEGLRAKLGVGGLDHLISQFGTFVAGLAGEQDVVARIDEHGFGLLGSRESQAELEQLAEQITHDVDQHAFGQDLPLTCSVGLCFLEDTLEDTVGIVNRAKAAGDEAFRDGGNRVRVHSTDEDSSEDAVDVVTEQDVRISEALRNDGFVIQYQPLLDLQTRGSETYEVLLRLQNAQGDLIGDRALTQLAESEDLCNEVDQWLLDRSIDILKSRRDSGKQTRLIVRQSGHNALNPDLPKWLSGRLRTKQVVGTGLILDFRLPDVSTDLKTAQHNIRALREMDVEVSLSRFPEKEAAFKVLRFLRASYISIAPRLLKADRKTIADVIRQAHEIPARVIVSNVDDPRSIDLHWSSGADFLQGNFVQRPLESMDYDFTQVVI